MSPALPVVSGAQVAAALTKGGFERVSQRGSHVKLRRADGRIMIVPLHRELAIGTLRSVIRQSGLSVEEFLGLL